jgi:hypothetical protein
MRHPSYDTSARVLSRGEAPPQARHADHPRGRAHSVAGRTGARTALITRRPCRAPPHTIPEVGRIGGGQVPTPGEGSLAHHGMSFWAAWPACRRHAVLRLLRDPADGQVGSLQAHDRVHTLTNPPGEAHLRHPLIGRRTVMVASTVPRPSPNGDGHCTAAGPPGFPSPPHRLPSQ